MGHSNGIITAPVNTDDVSAVIGHASHDVATLCTSPKINPAAIHCPRYSSENPGLYLRGANGASDGNSAGFQEIANQVRPKSGYECPRYGVWVPRYMLQNLIPSNYSTMATMARDEWYIKRPDTNSFKILDHFIGYYHNARVTEPIIQAPVTKITNGYKITVNFRTPAADNMTLSVSNLFGGRGYYFGAVIFRGTNPEGITQNDKMIVMGSKTAISNLSETSIQISKDDTSIDATKDYYYRIIPFVSNKASISETTLTDAIIYGLKINSDCPAIYEKATTAQPSQSEATVQYFNIKSGENGAFYPDPKNTAYPTGISTPDLVIAYSEIPESGYIKTNLNNLSYFNSLLNKYYRIEFHVSVLITGGNVRSMEYVFTWLRSGTDPDINPITRDTRFDNTGGRESELLFYVPAGKFWLYLAKLTGSNSIELQDMYGRFYYIDSLGYNKFEDTWATYIPDTKVE